MKRFIGLFFVLSTLIFSTKLFSQTEDGNKLGIGISLDPSRIGHASYYLLYGQMISTSFSEINASPIMFYVPININNNFRLEPSFGLFTMNNSNTSTPTYPGAFPTTNTNNGSTVTIGLRAVYLSSLSKSFGLYFGPRIDFSFISSSSGNSQFNTINGNNILVTTNTDLTETDINVGGVFGAEYFPVSHISLGGEVSFNYTKFGNPNTKYTTDPPQPSSVYTTTTETTQYSFHTDALFFLRWYFL